MEVTTIWLLAAALAHSAIAMSVYLIHLHDPQPPATFTLSDILSGQRRGRERRSPGFGGFKDLDTKSWFPWQSGNGGHVSSASSDFSPPDFGDFGGKKSHKSRGGGRGHKKGGRGKSRGGSGGGKGRAEASLGPIFTTTLKEVPQETRNKFNKPELTSTQARREKYDLNREFFTPPHAYRVAKEIPFFDTLDHKTVILTLENFREENTIALHKLKSLRPHFPFFVKD